jgi:hypothetical protein
MDKNLTFRSTGLAISLMKRFEERGEYYFSDRLMDVLMHCEGARENKKDCQTTCKNSGYVRGVIEKMRDKVRNSQ